MQQQKRFGTFQKADLFPNGSEAQPLPDHVRSRDDRSSEIAGSPAVTASLLDRGKDRFEIYCTPCHGYDGRGNGVVVQRGFPAPPSLLTNRLRQAPPEHFVDVITNGFGVMYPYAARVSQPDRWAITSYIRALQLAQGVEAANIPNADRVLK